MKRDCKQKLYHTLGADCPCIEPYAVVMDFCGWLSTRPETLKIGSSEDCVPLVEAIEKYVKAKNINEDIDITKEFKKLP